MTTDRLPRTIIEGREGDKFLKLLDLSGISDNHKTAMRMHFVTGVTKQTLINADLIKRSNWERVIQTIERKKIQIQEYVDTPE